MHKNSEGKGLQNPFPLFIFTGKILLIMLIGINGYAGSGKDTIGQIIRVLTSDIPMPTDYSTEKKINVIDKFLEPDKGYIIKKFANKLKQIASLLTGIPQEKFEDQEFKKTTLNYEWWTVCEEGSVPMFVREFLQKLGTDALRKGLHTNVWVNALMSDYKKDSKSYKQSCVRNRTGQLDI